MKKILFIIFATVSTVSVVIAQDANVYTPNGSKVYEAHLDSLPKDAMDLEAQIKEAKQIYYDSPLLNNYPSPYDFALYNCHGYAWHVEPDNGGPVWISVAPDIYVNDSSYYRIYTSPTVGDRVVYNSDNHSAVVYDIANNVFISKWGPLDLVKHPYDLCPYNSTDLWYYRRNPYNITSPSVIHPLNLIKTYSTNFSVNMSGSVTWTLTGPFSFSDTSIIVSITSNNTVMVYATGANDFEGILTATNSNNGTQKIIRPSVSITGPAELCVGQTASFTVNTPPSPFSWGCSSNISISGSGATVSVTLNSVSSNSYISIKNSSGVEMVRKKITIITPTPRSISGNGYFFFVNNYGYDTYNLTPLGAGGNISWTIIPTSGVGLSPNPTDLDYVTVYSYGVEDIYTLKATITYVSGCSIEAIKYIQIRDGNRGPSKVYPIPADQTLYIDLDDGSQPSSGKNPVFDVLLYDMQGNMVRQTKAKGGIVQFDVSNLLNGIYVVHIYDGINKTPQIIKVIIEH